MQVANGWVQVGSDRFKNSQVANRCANTLHKFQRFNGEYHAIIEIVEYELGRIAQKMIKCRSDMRMSKYSFTAYNKTTSIYIYIRSETFAKIFLPSPLLV